MPDNSPPRYLCHEPADALDYETGLDWPAYAIDDGRARLRSVVTSRRNGTVEMVDEGLRAGDALLPRACEVVELHSCTRQSQALGDVLG